MYVHMRKQKSELNRFLFASVFATFYMVKSAIKLRSPFMMIYDENSTWNEMKYVKYFNADSFGWKASVINETVKEKLLTFTFKNCGKKWIKDFFKQTSLCFSHSKHPCDIATLFLASFYGALIYQPPI